MIFCRYITNILSVHLLQSMKFSVNTAVLHAPLAYWHTLKEVLKIPSRKFHSKKFYFFHNTAIYLKVVVLTYDLHITRRLLRRSLGLLGELSGSNPEMTDPEMTKFGRHLRKYAVRLLRDHKVEFIERFLEK